MIQDIVVALLNIGGSSTHPNPKPISQLVTIVGTWKLKRKNLRARTREKVAKEVCSHWPSPPPNMPMMEAN